MALSNGFNLGLFVNANEGEVHTAALKNFLRGVDSLVMPVIQGYQSAPPVSPANGHMYAVAAAATGAWSGQEGKLARYKTADDPGWEFFNAKKGWSVILNTGAIGIEYTYTGSTWQTLAALPTFADQSAASALSPGELFKTSAGALMVKV